MDQAPRDRCENCGTPLTGEYCPECGQPDREYDVPITTFAKDMVSESFDLDSRLRATMRPLFFRPGLVPKEYVSGHRVRFVPPFRLYLVASFAMFLLMSMGSGINIQAGEGPQFEVDLGSGRAGAALEGAAAADTSDATESRDSAADSATSARIKWLADLETRLETRLAEGVERASQDPGAFAEEFSNRMAQAMFLLLPMFAVLLKSLYRKRLFVHHLVFAIYFHSWFFLLVAMTLVPGALGFELVSSLLAIFLAWAPVYLFLGMRRFYGQSRLRTGIKVFVLCQVYLLMATLAMLAVVIWAMTTA